MIPASSDFAARPPVFSARFLRAAALLLFAAVIAFPAGAQEPSSGIGTAGMGRRGRYTISGTVREAEGLRPVESVEVQLWTLASGMVASTYTSVNGNFNFVDVPSGTYYLIVNEKGYQRLQEEVNFTNRPPLGIQLTLEPDAAFAAAKVGSGPTVSKRDLSIPRRAREALERGLTLMNEKSDYKGSLAQFQRATREYPQYYEAYLHMGMAYLKMGDMAKSEESFRTSIDLSERKYPDALFHLAGFYSDQKRFTDAESLAREAIELNPLDPAASESYQELARALHGQDRSSEAEAAALEAARIQPTDPQTHLILANIHLKLRNYTALITDLDNFLRLAPNSPEAEHARQMREQVLERMANIQPRTP